MPPSYHLTTDYQGRVYIRKPDYSRSYYLRKLKKESTPGSVAVEEELTACCDQFTKCMTETLHGSDGAHIGATFVTSFSQRQWYFMTILAVVVAFVSVLIDSLAGYLSFLRLSFFKTHWHAGAWIGPMVGLTLLACLLLQFLNPHVAGSGIPEMKFILLQIHEFRYYLHWRAYAPKILGLILVLASGLPVGKEGPFVHISCIFAKLFFFSKPKWRVNLVKRLQNSACVTCPVFSTITLPLHSQVTQIDMLFSNFTWWEYLEMEHSKNNMSSPYEAFIVSQWVAENAPNFQINLLWYSVLKMLLSCLATTFSVPCGLVAPMFCIGAALGRGFGEMCHQFFSSYFHHSLAAKPFSFAVVGAACVAGAVTQTLSTTVIIAEMTGEIDFILPCIMAVLTANFVVKILGIQSIFESSADIKKLPLLPTLSAEVMKNLYEIPAAEVMCPRNKIITLHQPMMTLTADGTYVMSKSEQPSTLNDIRKILLKHSSPNYSIVMEDTDLLICEVTDAELRRYLREKFLLAMNIPMTEMNEKDPFVEELAVLNDSELEELGRLLNTEYVSSQTRESSAAFQMVADDAKEAVKSFLFADDERRTLLQDAVRKAIASGGVVRWREALLTAIDWTSNRKLQCNSVALQVNSRTDLDSIYKLFNLLYVGTVHVVDNCRLVGVITRKELRDALEDAYRRTRERHEAGTVEDPENPVLHLAEDLKD